MSSARTVESPQSASSFIGAEGERILGEFETRLDPARPGAQAGVQIIGYGEVSTVFTIAEFPGLVCKRMAGFRTIRAVERYIEVMERYVQLLAGIGLRVAETRPVPVLRPAGRPVVYLVQPRVDPRGLGNQLLREADDAVLLTCMDQLLASLRLLMLANRAQSEGRTVAVDGQLSNWHFAVEGDRPSTPLLLDVGTPFMRLKGVDELDLELFLAPAPPLLRTILRRAGAAQHYIDDYFDPRTLLLDLVGNFHKEGRPDRIALVVAHVNRWLAGTGVDLGVRPITCADADRYYARDARTLELYLKLRRLDRFVRSCVLRRRYDFILPGAIRR